MRPSAPAVSTTTVWRVPNDPKLSHRPRLELRLPASPILEPSLQAPLPAGEIRRFAPRLALRIFALRRATVGEHREPASVA